jgi:hypothetical protein
MQLQEAELDGLARKRLAHVLRWLDLVEHVDDAVLWHGAPVWVLDDAACRFVADPGQHPVPPSDVQMLAPQSPPARGVALFTNPLRLDEIGFLVYYLSWGAVSTELGLVRFGGGQAHPQPLMIEAAGAQWPESDERVVHRVMLECRWIDSAPQSPLVVPLLHLWYLITESSVRARVWDPGRPPVIYLAAE